LPSFFTFEETKISGYSGGGNYSAGRAWVAQTPREIAELLLVQVLLAEYHEFVLVKQFFDFGYGDGFSCIETGDFHTDRAGSQLAELHVASFVKKLTPKE
jgi:hypothetical protein